MILRSIRVRRYKNLLDSGEVEVQPDVTCLVGKNESGKSALLQALYRLNPVPTGHPETFVGLRDYPRREYARDRGTIAERCPIEATFELEDEDVRAVEEVCGPGALSSRWVTVARSYENRLVWDLGADGGEGSEAAVVEAAGEGGDESEGEGPPAAMADAAQASQADGSPADETSSWDERLVALGFDDDDEPDRRAGALDGSEDQDAGDEDDAGEGVDVVEEAERDVQDLLEERLPRFLYFDDYSLMPGRLSVPKALAAGGHLTPGERSALSLIRLAGVDLDDFTRDEYEARKASIESASSDLTRQIFEYWSQNRNLSVEFDADFQTRDADGVQGPFIELRIRNHRHGVTLNFSDRSQGFTWFFSLLASLSSLRDPKRLILLLDEPGASLHASAQHDLRRFIDERLIPTHQVVYSTHSPFMVDPGRLERVRAVEDRDGEGSRVSEAILDQSGETRIPVEAALGQDLVHSLAAAGGDLFVKAPSDLVYLSAMSAHLESLGRTCLDPRWSIVPVGGLVGLSAFGALMDGGAKRMAVLFDAPAVGGGAAAGSLVGRKLLESRGILRIADFMRVRPPAVEVDAPEDEEGETGAPLETDAEDAAAGADTSTDAADGGFEMDEEAEIDRLIDAGEEFEPSGESENVAISASGVPASPGPALESGGAPAVRWFSPFADFRGVAAEKPAAEPEALDVDPMEIGEAEAPPEDAGAGAAGAGPTEGEPGGWSGGGDGGDAEARPDGGAPEAPAALEAPAGGGLEIEDLFAEDFYLDLVNRSGVAAVVPFEVRGARSIVRRVEAATGLGLDRLRPARLLVLGEDDPLDGLDELSRERFESLFIAINEVLAE